jgi:hypothetical protein
MWEEAIFSFRSFFYELRKMRKIFGFTVLCTDSNWESAECDQTDV